MGSEENFFLHGIGTRKKNQGYTVHWLLAVLQTGSGSFYNLRIIQIGNHLLENHQINGIPITFPTQPCEQWPALQLLEFCVKVNNALTRGQFRPPGNSPGISPSRAGWLWCKPLGTVLGVGNECGPLSIEDRLCSTPYAFLNYCNLSRLLQITAVGMENIYNCSWAC